MAQAKEVAKCPELGHVFSGNCQVTTCKNWAKNAENKCLALARHRLKDSEVISLEEIARYKGITVDEAYDTLEEASGNVRRLTILHYYVDFAASYVARRANGSPTDVALTGPQGLEGEAIELWLNAYPMACGLWHLTPAVVRELLSPDRFKEFISTTHIVSPDDGYDHLDILCLSDEDYRSICAELDNHPER